MKNNDEEVNSQEESYSDYNPENEDNYIDNNRYSNQGFNFPSMPGNRPSIKPYSNTVDKNPALGEDIKGNNDEKNDPNKQPEDKKNDVNNKNKKNDDANKVTNQNNNPALGQNNKKNEGNGLPGAKKNDKNKDAQNGDPRKQKALDNKKKQKQEKENITNKKNSAASRMNPFNRSKKGNSKGKTGGGDANGLKGTAGKGVKSILTALPFQAKIAVIGGASVILIAGFIILLLTTSIATGTAIGVSLCGDASTSSYNGADYAGGADTKKFLCKMQSPLGKRQAYIYGWVGEPRSNHTHSGVDLSDNASPPIYAVQTGEVVSAGTEGGYGNSVVIKHGNGEFYTRYGHLAKILVKKGKKVGKGQKIGIMGSTGNSEGIHLHFEVRIGSNYGTSVKAINDYFNASKSTEHSKQGTSEQFKKSCGSSWEGEPTGDSANAANDTGSDLTFSSLTSNGECCDTSSSSGGSSSNYCPNGVSVKGDKTYELDDYIARVVTNENGSANDEALKALAVAARTYTLSRTNNCSKAIRNSTKDQVMFNGSESNDNLQKIKSTISEVNGAIMLYNGNYFSAEYSSFWGSCSGDNCTGKDFIKVPSNKKGTSYKMPKSFYTIMGHDRGLSQNGSNYMASQGKKYDEILKFFYADGIEINGASGGTCSVGGDSYNGKIWVYYQADYPQSYGCSGSTIASSGCGPTAMAMAVSSMLNEKHDPVELAKLSLKTGNRVCGTGTKHSFFATAAKKYGLTSETVGKNNSGEVLTALNSGKSLVIAAMGKGTFTRGGHFILLTATDGKNVTVQDPAGKKNSRSFNFKDPVLKEASQFFIISK